MPGKPPNARDLLNSVYQPKDPRRRREVDDFRAQGLLADDARYVPRSLDKRTKKGKERIQEFWAESDSYLDPDRSWSGFNYENQAGGEDYWGRPVPGIPVMPDDQSTDTSPAPLSEIPTSTIFPRRPRTVAAGFIRDDIANKQGKLTVVFRDGTFYNYYDVSQQDWYDFRRAYSKGKFIKARLDGKRRGVANMFSSDRSQWADDGYMETLYRAARTAQLEQGGIQSPGGGVRQREKSPVRRQHWHRSSWKRRGYKNPSYVGRSKPNPKFNRPY